MGRGVVEDRVNFRETPVGAGRLGIWIGCELPTHSSIGPAWTWRWPAGVTMESSRGVRRKETDWEAPGFRWMRWKPARARMGAPSVLGWEM